MLGALRTATVFEHALGLVLVVGMVVVWTRLHLVTLQLKEQEQQSRWASSLRDLLNLTLVGTLWAGLSLSGFPGPAAFLFAGTLGIALDVIRHAAPQAQRRQRLMLVGVLPAGALLAAFPKVALDVTNGIVGVLWAG
jgi:hypothetical protein